MTLVVGTAGHIDHGKTSLLRALTGIDADRLPEERRRGMTIDVGYAHLRLPDGDELDFVDVPGHDRLIGNMLVGAGEIDAALLVVAADDGPRAQTLEHLELLDALGIANGVVAVTKIDVVDAERVAAVVADVGRILGRTMLAGSPIVPVASLRGDGIDELRARLSELRDRARDRAAVKPGTGRSPRLAVDRVFSVKGRGTVVTGSLRGGPLVRGDVLRLEPGGRTVRAREIQVHGATVASAPGGGRVAMNLAGVMDPPPVRGDVLTMDRAVVATQEILAVLRRPAALDDRAPRRPNWPPDPGSVTRLHLGTASTEARVGRGRRDLADLPDGRRVVRLRLDRPIAAAIGDAFVLRRPSPVGAVAGGVILDPQPPIGASRRRVTAERLVALLPSEAGVSNNVAARLDLHGVLLEVPGELDPHAGRTVPGRVLAGHRLAPDLDVAIQADLLAAIEASSHPGGDPGVSSSELRAGLARAIRRRVTVDHRAALEISSAVVDSLVAEGRLTRSGDRLLAAGTSADRGPSPEMVASMARLERILAVPAPPALGDALRASGSTPEAARLLERSGRIVRLDDDLAYAATTFAELGATALRLSTAGPVTPASFRDATGTSRKYVMAILEELDRRGVLRRTPAGHVAGPRAPR
ncbi:MAG: selenocysteine-specific translation elongation factor [Chloroflexi bacterium]|nr:selenocysteine-specific translation elongation factor [Chloroflexota bacterium]